MRRRAGRWRGPGKGAPPRGGDESLALRDHHAPFGDGWLHAKAWITDRRAVQEHEHGVGHRENEAAGDRVGQQVAEHDPRAAEPQAAGRDDEILCFEHEDLGPDQRRVRHPAHQRHRDIKACQSRPEDGDDREHQHEKRKSENDVDKAHQDRVDDATKETRDGANDGAQYKGKPRR